MRTFHFRRQEVTFATVVVPAVFFVRPSHGFAQEVVLTSGELKYQQSYALCHGREGHGDGAMAELLKKKPADLTQLRKENRGQFPTRDSG